METPNLTIETKEALQLVLDAAEDQVFSINSTPDLTNEAEAEAEDIIRAAAIVRKEILGEAA